MAPDQAPPAERRWSLHGLLSVATLSVSESWRNPLFAVVWVAAMVLAGALASFDFVAFSEQRALVTDSLRALALSVGSLLGIMLAVTAISGDRLRGGLELWLVRGVRADGWLAGRLLGLALALAPLALTLGLAPMWASRITAQWPVRDLAVERTWFITLGLALAVALLIRARGRPVGPALVVLLPGAYALATVVLASVGWGWAGEDVRLLPFVLQAWAGATLATAVAGCLALWIEGTAALLVAAALWLACLMVPALASAGTAWLWRLPPSWRPFQTMGGWGTALAAAAYALCYGAALVAVAGGSRRWRETR